MPCEEVRGSHGYFCFKSLLPNKIKKTDMIKSTEIRRFESALCSLDVLSIDSKSRQKPRLNIPNIKKNKFNFK